VWTDNETTDDLLGFRVHADLIRAVVMDETLLPVTIGIFGDWGGGKTSVLRMLEQDLDPDRWQDPAERARYEKVACLYINGWLFEGYDDAKSALLSAVLLALGEHKRFGAKARDKVVSLLKSVNWMRVARLGLKEVALPAIAAYVTGGARRLRAAATRPAAAPSS
jgi:predicted KAP-like P-loop ATPase